MEPVYFVTSNEGKVESLRNILAEAKLPISIEMLQAKYPEDKSLNSTTAIAEAGALYCAQKFQKEVIVTDVGLFIKALKGFPGINTAFTLKHIGTEGLVKLLEGKKNHQATWELSLAYASPAGTSQVWTEKTEGEIAKKPRGKFGFGFDPIFIPAGHSQTLAEAEGAALRDIISPFRAAVLAFGNSYAANPGLLK